MTGRNPQLIVLSDGIRGHVSQTRGLAAALMSMASTVQLHEIDVPLFAKGDRIRRLKMAARALAKAGVSDATRWLREAGAGDLLNRVSSLVAEGDESPLFLSAGSSAAPFCLALAKALRGKSCVVMTPSTLGTSPFDMAVVPRHDNVRGDNAFVTLGAPNCIDRTQLVKEAQTLLLSYPLHRARAWGVLVGGDDRNYRITPRWVEKFFPRLFEMARLADVDLYVTTSRRTTALAEAAIQDHCEAEPRVVMLLLASKDERNPVPGMLGFCEKIFCTEDSVSMISEAATAGVPLAVIPVEHSRGVNGLLQRGAELLSCSGLLSPEKLWGEPRFRRMIDDFAALGLLKVLYPEEIGMNALNAASLRPAGEAEFNEARKAAEWILSRWRP